MFDLYNLETYEWIIAFMSAILIGASKTGISGAGMISIPLFAAIFGGKPSAGLILPMLSVADIFAVKFYNRHAEWKYIIKLLPWTVAGIICGLIVGKIISDKVFKELIGILILGSLGVLIYRDIKGAVKVPTKLWFSALMGFLGGFATMIGNAAGPVMALYLLSMQLPKNSYIGTGAWFFFIVNLFKIPLHIIFWKTITMKSLLFDAAMIPALALGAILGVQLVKLIPEKIYRIFIIVITAISSIFLF